MKKKKETTQSIVESPGELIGLSVSDSGDLSLDFLSAFLFFGIIWVLIQKHHFSQRVLASPRHVLFWALTLHGVLSALVYTFFFSFLRLLLICMLMLISV